MIFFFVIAIFFIFLTYIFYEKKNSSLGMQLAFFFLWIFSSLRYKFGNDYDSYENIFKIIEKSNIADYNFISSYEIGFVLLNRIFSGVGFNMMLSLISLFSCITYFYFIKKYVKKNLRWIALSIYMLNPFLFLIHLSAIRQGIAICIFIWSLKFIERKKFTKYAIMIGIALLFHKSAFLLLPLYFLNNKTFQSKHIFLFVGVLAYLTLFFNKNLISFIQNIVGKLYPSYLIYFENIDKEKINTGIGIIINFFYFCLSLKYYNIAIKNKLALKNYFIFLILSVLGIAMSMLGRVTMYFEVFQIVVIPFFIEKITKQNKKIFVIFYFALLIIYYFKFYNALLWDSFKEYHFIFGIENL